MNRSSYFHILSLITVVLFVSANAEAQTGGSSVTLKASVSGVVTLSVAPNSTDGGVDVVSSGNTVRVTLSGTGARSSVIRVPLIVRSNIDFKISGTFDSTTAQLTQLSVLDVRPTGTLVSPEAVNNVDIPSQFDLRGQTERTSLENGPSVLDVSDPFFVLSGPRVSLGGTLNSANNALQVTLVIRIKSESVGGWLAHLTFFNH